METCTKHNRWIRLDYADGTVKTRSCPECPRSPRRFLHIPTGRVMTPALVVESDGRITSNAE